LSCIVLFCLVLSSRVCTLHLQRKYAGALRIGANGACSLLFCAAKRSAVFPPNLPVRLRVRVSRLGGFKRLNSGKLSPLSWGPAFNIEYVGYDAKIYAKLPRWSPAYSLRKPQRGAVLLLNPVFPRWRPSKKSIYGEGGGWRAQFPLSLRLQKFESAALERVSNRAPPRACRTVVVGDEACCAA
jgi:hypothetical protein